MRSNYPESLLTKRDSAFFVFCYLFLEKFKGPLQTKIENNLIKHTQSSDIVLDIRVPRCLRLNIHCLQDTVP